MQPTPGRGDPGDLTQSWEHVFWSLNSSPSPLIDGFLSFSYNAAGAAWHIHARYAKNLLSASV